MSKIKIDMNNLEFQKDLFALEKNNQLALISRSVRNAVDVRDNTCLWLKIISKSIRFLPYFVQNLMDFQNFIV